MNLEYIYNFIDGMELSKHLKNKKEIKILPEYIDADEEIKYICTCSLSGNNWVCIVTTKKVLFLDKSFFNYVNKIVIPVENITYVTDRQYTIDGEVFIGQGDIAAVLSSVDKKDLKRLTDSIKNVSKNLIDNKINNTSNNSNNIIVGDSEIKLNNSINEVDNKEEKNIQKIGNGRRKVTLDDQKKQTLTRQSLEEMLTKIIEQNEKHKDLMNRLIKENECMTELLNKVLEENKEIREEISQIKKRG